MDVATDAHNFEPLADQCREYISTKVEEIESTRNDGLPERTKFYMMIGKFHLLCGEAI